MKKNYLFLNSFYLKLIAIITMTIDHIGSALMSYFPNNTAQFATGIAFRYIGRISLPLIIFILVIGALKTHDIKKYLLRMGIAAAALAVVLIPLQYAGNFKAIDGNIFLALFLLLLSFYLLSLKGYKKAYILLPAAYVIFTFFYSVYGKSTFPFPVGLLPEYTLYAYLMGILIYSFAKLYDSKIQKGCIENKVDYEEYKTSNDYKRSFNLVAIGAIIIVIILYFTLKYINVAYDIYNDRFQSYAILSVLFIFFYNHERGYKNKYSQYAFYIYYPVHLAIIFGIFMLIF
ncbi:MAG: TraX family protein [Bacilli bacterium]